MSLRKRPKRQFLVTIVIFSRCIAVSHNTVIYISHAAIIFCSKQPTTVKFITNWVCFCCNIRTFSMFEKRESQAENKVYKNICSPPKIEKLRYNGKSLLQMKSSSI